jgi:hypothetical protein
VAVGTTPPLNDTMQDQQEQQEETYEEEEEYGNEESMNYREDGQEEEDQASYNSNRLEVTLTAEPDKPIMVEVRGGEKQFLISALTKHIYEILSQPHRLQMTRDEYEASFDEVPQQNPLKVNKNINLKLRSLKKTLQKNPGPRGGGNQMFDTQTRNEMVNNLGASPSKSAITIEELDQSSKFDADETRGELRDRAPEASEIRET